MPFTDSIAALSSGHLPSGVAIVRISGPDVRFALETIAGFLPKPRQAYYGALHAPDGKLVDHGITLFFPGPNSFTGEDCGEFQVHGGSAVVASLLTAIGKLPGFRQAESGEFTKRAFLNGKIDLLEAEALADLINAETETQRQFAIMNSGGAQSKFYLGWRKRLIHARAVVEAETDFAEEANISESVSSQVWHDMKLLIEEIQNHVDGYGKAEIIREGFDVVILGAPNAGKSSLLNTLLQREVAIVTDEPGTTRDLVEAVFDLDGLKVRITDTAGLRVSAGKIETIGIERAKERAKDADLVLFLEDMSDPSKLSPPDGVSSIVIGTKVDRCQQVSGDQYALMISTTTGQGMNTLLKIIGDRAFDAIGKRGDILPSRLRHIELLEDAQNYLVAALRASDALLELKAENLRLASNHIGKLAGAVDVEDLLDAIFSQFCIGK